MNLLVTAGNTLVPIDQVRGITNIFTGRTGAGIALEARRRGHQTVLLTSHPEVITAVSAQATSASSDLQVHPYRTFDDLQELMARFITAGDLDAVIHCAAVSDYRSDGIYAPQAGTRFDAEKSRWLTDTGPPTMVDRAAGKVKSDEPELWLRLLRTPKLVDRIRSDWKFKGMLVKFKLEVGLSEAQLVETSERSRRQSAADLMIANTLEGASHWAYLGPVQGGYQRIPRHELAARLLDTIESSK